MGPYSDEEQLAELRHHWDTAYRISRPEPFTWLAQRRDTRETLTAESADGLFGVIYRDYEARPVPRGEADDDGDPEGWCTVCGARAGYFIGYDGPRHFRGEGTPDSPLVLLDAGHDPVMAWRNPEPGGAP